MTATIATAEEKRTNALIDLFTERIAPLGVEVVRASGIAEAADYLERVIREEGQNSAMISGELRCTAPGLIGAVRKRGLDIEEVTTPESALDVPVGFVLGMHAVAETGSVLLAESTLADRAVGMLSLTCVQIVQTETLLPGLDETGAVLRRLALRPNGAYASLVTGPSRTADIEMSLTVGVQGPGKVAVLFVDELFG
ncbi:MAG: LUD domain-containing protein [Thermomicrobiales bacterium]|nr:LUD domain-containing protein [Thermomicrobiales bacterium]